MTPTTTAAAVAGATSSSIVELAQGLEAVAKVPESDIGRIRLGQDAEVRVDAFPDRRFPARVKRITPRAVKLNNVTSFDVVLAFLKPEPQLRIGMTADIGFQTGRVQADTLVPTVAIVTEEGRPGVLLVGRDNQPTFQPVELGVSGGGFVRESVETLRAGWPPDPTVSELLPLELLRSLVSQRPQPALALMNLSTAAGVQALRQWPLEHRPAASVSWWHLLADAGAWLHPTPAGGLNRRSGAPRTGRR
ncbi:efflux RND transporter periplasmic adaptor subunit [Synechococcus sp. GFB01]|uniref:efflux RND transporter periplasmic adaptor subunit n=1 Tax=Synechococcus sp. GFB01 TaxID=1662190 RepID=UPI00069DB975